MTFNKQYDQAQRLIVLSKAIKFEQEAINTLKNSYHYSEKTISDIFLLVF